jgi:Ca2+-binding EF-hand superfamily protein
MSTNDPETVRELLTSEEVGTIVEKFDELDLNQNGLLTLDEYERYLAVRRGGEHELPTPADEADLAWFTVRDADGDGVVSWDEFLEAEALNVLARRGPKALRAILSAEEVSLARRRFTGIDRDGSGTVTRQEALDAFRAHFAYLFEKQGRAGETVAIDALAKSQALMFMTDNDEDGDLAVTWDEYINTQARFLLAARSIKPRKHK